MTQPHRPKKHLIAPDIDPSDPGPGDIHVGRNPLSHEEAGREVTGRTTAKKYSNPAEKSRRRP